MRPGADAVGRIGLLFGGAAAMQLMRDVRTKRHKIEFVQGAGIGAGLTT